MLLERLAARMNGRRLPGEPPLEPGNWPWLGSALEFGRDLPALLDACQRKHGDVFTLVVAGKRMTFVLDPLDFPELLRRVDDLSFTEIADDISVQAFGHSRVVETPGVREGIHGLYAPHLKAARLGPLSEGFGARLDAVLAAVTPTTGTCSLYEFVNQVVFAAGTDALFGTGTADAAGLAAFKRFDAAFPLLAAGVPTRLLPGVHRAQRWLAKRVGPLRPDASAIVAERDAFVRGRLSPRDRDGIQLGLLWAALANTTPAAFWTLAHTLADPAARDDLRAEIDPLLATSNGACGREQLRQMTRLDSAVSEALRLASSSLTMRLVRRTTVVQLDSGGPWTLRQGDRVCMAPFVTHRDPTLYPEPDRYRHDRFIRAQFVKNGKKVGFALMPFGGGVSMCPGRFLANEDIKHLVARVLHRLDAVLLGPLPALDQRRAGLGVLPPRGELMVRLRPRA